MADLKEIKRLKTDGETRDIGLFLRRQDPRLHSPQYCLDVADLFNDKSHNQQDLVDFITRTIKLYPQSDRLYVTRACIWLGVDETDLAEPDIRRAIALNPKSPAAYSALCELFRNRQNFAAALEAVDKAIACNGDKYQLYDQRAEILTQQFKIDQAEQSFRESIKYATPQKSWLPRAHLARMLKAAKRFGLALQEFKALGGANPAGEWRVEIADCLIALGRHKEALESLQGTFPDRFELEHHKLKKACYIALKNNAQAKKEDEIIAKLSADF